MPAKVGICVHHVVAESAIRVVPMRRLIEREARRLLSLEDPRGEIVNK